jgi:hypothetical protein
MAMDVQDGFELVQKILDPMKRETYTQLAVQLDEETRLLMHIRELESGIHKLIDKPSSVFVLAGTAVWLGLLGDNSTPSNFPDIWYWQPRQTSLLLEPPVLPTPSVPALDLSLV